MEGVSLVMFSPHLQGCGDARDGKMSVTVGLLNAFWRDWRLLHVDVELWIGWIRGQQPRETTNVVPSSSDTGQPAFNPTVLVASSKSGTGYDRFDEDCSGRHLHHMSWAWRLIRTSVP